VTSGFPNIDLPIAPPFPPMEARTADALPEGDDWQYEPKWDGFRCLGFKHGPDVLLQSKSGQPLGRYFPELVEALASLEPERLVVDGEIVIVRDNQLSFNDLLQRIHPAESRVRKLAKETPAALLVFDLLVQPKGDALVSLPLSERRQRLDALFETLPASKFVQRSPFTTSRAEALAWMEQLGAAGLDGVVAKHSSMPYRSGERDGMVKVKRIRTADCIVAAFRYAQKSRAIGSLLLGLVGDDGAIHHVGFTSSFTAEERKGLKPVVTPLMGGKGFTGRAPGGPSRWTGERSTAWEPLDPKLVCEVRYDHFSGGRFRHGTKFLRWRPDKNPSQCTFDQVMPALSGRLLSKLKVG